MDFNHEYDNPNNRNLQNNRPEGFAIASLLCGILSNLCCCTGVLSIPVGALGILFAILTKRKGRRMSGLCIAGIWLSCVGIALGLLLTAYFLYTIFSDPAALEQFITDYNIMFESLYGMSLEEYMNSAF